MGAMGPRRAWDLLAEGGHPEDPAGRARVLARPGRPDVLWRRCLGAGVSVVTLGSPAYPGALAADPEAPAVLFYSGSPGALAARPRVAVVGTRSASSTGREVARHVGGCLARAGAVVVSGLAAGIDSEALAGAVEAGGVAVAVLGAAHDALHEPDQRRLARLVEQAGCVVSELPPGAESARWRFAARNRVMAALAQLVVVVECHEAGGALHTVRAARRRNVPVAAVPGSVRASSSAGTNALLAAGAFCVRHGDDVVSLLARLAEPGQLAEPGRLAEPGELAEPGRQRTAASTLTRRTGPRGAAKGELDPLSRRVLGALDEEAVSLDAVVLRTGESLSSVALALERLAAAGLARSEAGFWTRCGPSRRRG
jgi:DNA protecting protein DprA